MNQDLFQTSEVAATVPPAERLARAVSGSKIPGLDAVRAGAVGLVVIGHYMALPTGNLGVEMFFVLSGFLITTLLLKELAKTGTVSLAGFYRRRVRRIFPAYYVFWAISLAIAVFEGHAPREGQLAATFFYFTNYYQALINTSHPFIRHGWSLAVEEQFYLLWPLFFRTFGSNLRRLAWMTLGVALACVSWRIAAFALWKSAADWYAYNVFECRADQLLWGCLLAVALHRRWFSRFFAALCASPWFLVLTAAALLFSARQQPSGAARGISGYLVEGLLSAVLLVQAMGLTTGSAAWRLLNNPLGAFGARISYPLYLYHLLPRTSGIVAGLNMWRAAAVGIPLSIAMAVLSYELVEKRFLRPAGALKAGPISTWTEAPGPEPVRVGNKG